VNAPNPDGLVLADGTPISLRLTRSVSSSIAKPGDKIHFEAAEDVKVGPAIVIKKHSPAEGTVTAARSAKMFGRGGKLAIEIDSVTLADGETAKLRRTKSTSGDGIKGQVAAEAMIGAPFQLFDQGEDAVLETDWVVTAYVNGAMHLDATKFKLVAVVAPAVPSDNAQLRITSNPSGADILVDGKAVGSTPLEVQLSQGLHTITISKTGFRSWERTMDLPAGSTAIAPTLYPTSITFE
jgi:hypothetical protein